ncbi:MAG TPA: hypothetical protein VF885_16550 [Arthrobacter sp.]
MTDQPRVLKGAAGAGRFARTARSESGLALRAPSSTPPRPNEEWHEMAERMVEGGASPATAKASVSKIVSLQLVRIYLDNTQKSLGAGRETDAALYTIAFTAMRDMPTRMEKAGEDPAALRTITAETRASLQRAGSLLDGIHPSGRQPVFAAADNVMAGIEEFLADDSTQTPE